jgi:elongator complex protein 4
MSFKRRQKTTLSPSQNEQRHVDNNDNDLSLKYLDVFGATLTSTGVPSLDDILGGGLALTSIFTVLDPNPHSSHADLVLKHFIAQGILSHHRIFLVDLSGDDFVQKCPWVRPEPNSVLAVSTENRPDSQAFDSVKIAWRYQHLSHVSTTIE